MSRARAVPLVFALALLGLVLVHFGASLLGDRDPFVGDVYRFEAPRNREQRASLLRGEGIPLWYPGVYGGAPALASQELAPLYPPNVVLAALAPERATALGLALHALLAAAGAGALARRLGARPEGAALAAVVYAFSGPLLSLQAVPAYARSAAWLPWVVLGLLRAGEREGRGLALAVLALAGTYLGGDPFGCVLASAASLLVAAVSGGRSAVFGVARALPLAGAIALALSAAQLLPAAAAARDLARSGGYTFEEATRASLWPAELVGTLAPCVLGLPSDPPGFLLQAIAPGNEAPWHRALYLGPVAVALAVAGAARARRDPVARAGLALLVVFLPLALGRFTPLYAAIGTLPGVSLLRFPAKLFEPALLGVVLLAASGASAAASGERASLKITAGVLAALGALGLLATNALTLAAESLGESLAAGPLGDAGRDAVELAAPRAAHAAFVALGAAAVAGARKGRGRVLALVALATLDLALGLHAIVPFAPRAALAREPRVAARLEKLSVFSASPVRVLPTEGALPALEDVATLGTLAALQRARIEALAPNTGLGHGVLSQAGFLSSPPLRRGALEAALGRAPLGRRAALLGARVVLCSADEAGALAGTQVWSEPGRALVALDDAPPWAAVYRRARFARDLEASVRGIVRRDFDPRRETVLECEPANGAADVDPVPARCESFAPASLVLGVDAPEGGWLVVRESYARGWEARVDGVPAPVLPADAVFRAVALPAGAKRVELVFHAPWAAVGACVSALAAVACVLAALRARRAAGARASEPKAAG